MTAHNATVTERRAYLLTWECAEDGCANTFTLNILCSPAYVSRRKLTPPPDADGWVGGYCPEHATTGGTP